MARAGPNEACITFGEGLSEDQRESLRGALSSIGLQVPSRPRPTFRDPMLLVLLVVLPALNAFLGSLGEDAYRVLRSALEKIFHTSSAKRREVVFQDGSTGAQIVLEQGLPEEAYEQLHDLDLSEVQSGTLWFFDRDTGRWTTRAKGGGTGADEDG